MSDRDQLPLPFVAEPPGPGPRPDRRQAVAIERKPPERQLSAIHPDDAKRSA